MDEPSTSAVPDYLLVKDRSLGVMLLTILNLLGGILLAGMLIFGAFFFRWEEHREQIKQVLEAFGVPLWLVIASFIFLAVLALMAGIEMWRGSRWGWRLGSFGYAYAILCAANGLLFVHQFASTMPPEELAAMPGGIGRQYTKFAGRLVVSTLLYLYFFKKNVREYFGLGQANPWKAVGWQFGACAALFVAFTLLAT